MSLFAFVSNPLATPLPSAVTPPDATPADPGHLGVLPRVDQRISVRSAYARFRRQRTAFGQEGEPLRDAAGLSLASRRYFSALFAAVDQAVVLRVESLTLRMADPEPTNLARARRGYRALLGFLKNLHPPAALGVAHQQVIDAIAHQRNFFRACDTGETGLADSDGLARHAEVRAASVKLQSAHSALMSSFPHVSAHNRRAFFDHLSALDFI